MNYLIPLYALRIAAFFGFAALLVMIASTGHAAEVASTTTVNLGGLWDGVLPLIRAAVEAVIGALLGWMAIKIKTRTGLDIEAQHRAALHSAAVTGIDLALSRAGDLARRTDIDVRSAILAEAAGWVARSVPDALTYLNVTPEKVRDLVESKLTDAIGHPALPADLK